MKPLDWSYELHIFGTRPRALPLQDFGELAKRFADLLGSAEHVHFGALRAGSARLLVKVEEYAHMDVQVQLLAARTHAIESPKVVRIDDYLKERGWRGEVRSRDGKVLLTFEGAAETTPHEKERTVQQMDTLVGQVIKIGGRDETVPMQLRTSDGSYIDVTVRGRPLASKLGHYLFGTEVRVSGLATWKRDSEGQWSCVNMLVDQFEEPDCTPLRELFDSLSDVPDNGWNALDDPIEQWKKLRGDD